MVVAILVGYSWTSVSVTAPNERSRIYLAVAMVDHGEVNLDEPVARWGRMFDMSRVDDHWYSNKPLGVALVGTPLYRAVRVFSPPADWSIEDLLMLYRFGLMLPVALLGFIALYKLVLRLGLDESTAQLASTGWVLATPAFHYAGAYFSHHLVAVCLVVGAWLIVRTSQQRQARGRRPSDYAALGGAGLSLGVAGMAEYQAGVACAMVAIFLLSRPNLRDLRSLGAFAMGVVPCLVALGLYNTVVFGGPLELSYTHQAKQDYAVLGKFTLPRWEHFKGLMFSSHRGLMLIAPWLALAPFGAVYYWRHNHRRLAVLASAIGLFWILLISGYAIWFGGWGYGPRHLVASVGMLSLLAAGGLQWAFERGKWVAGLAVGAMVAGLVQNQIMEAFFAEPPPGMKNPLVDIAYTMASNGYTGPNLLWLLTDWPHLYTLLPLGALVVGVTIFWIWRGIGAARGSGRLATIVAMLVTVLPTAAIGALVYTQGPSGDAKTRKRVLKWAKRWERVDEHLFEPVDEPAKGQ